MWAVVRPTVVTAEYEVKNEDQTQDQTQDGCCSAATVVGTVAAAVTAVDSDAREADVKGPSRWIGPCADVGVGLGERAGRFAVACIDGGAWLRAPTRLLISRPDETSHENRMQSRPERRDQTGGHRREL